MIHYRKGKQQTPSAIGPYAKTLCGISVFYKDATASRKKLNCSDCLARLVRRDAKRINKAAGCDPDTLEKELDELWGKIVRKKNGGKCARCGKPAENAHHVISRRHKSIKWDPRVGMPLCMRCHLYWVPSGDVGDVTEYLALVRSFIGERTLAILQTAKRKPYHPSISDLRWIKVDLQTQLRY